MKIFPYFFFIVFFCVKITNTFSLSLSLSLSRKEKWSLQSEGNQSIWSSIRRYFYFLENAFIFSSHFEGSLWWNYWVKSSLWCLGIFTEYFFMILMLFGFFFSSIFFSLVVHFCLKLIYYRYLPSILGYLDLGILFLTMLFIYLYILIIVNS